MFAQQLKMIQAAVLAAQFLTVETMAERAPWSCNELEYATDPFYRMFPASLGKAYIDQHNVITNRIGRCFQDISITSDFNLNEA